MPQLRALQLRATLRAALKRQLRAPLKRQMARRAQTARRAKVSFAVCIENRQGGSVFKEMDPMLYKA